MKAHPEDVLRDVLGEIAREIGFAHARLINHAYPPEHDRPRLERQWIERLTEILITYDADGATFPDYVPPS